MVECAGGVGPLQAVGWVLGLARGARREWVRPHLMRTWEASIRRPNSKDGGHAVCGVRSG